ncbi:STICHEL protein [Nymphaea thermarum]|nr:STICHEL protein [Nymphaea thermarum]
MVRHSTDSGELRLKKELSALGKARFLRDPETCSSWRSPVSTTRFSTICAPPSHSPGARAGGGGSEIGMSNSVPERKDAEVLFELDHSSLQPAVPIGREKSIFLYNWRHRSSGKGKWSFSNVLGGENGRIHPNRDDMQGSVNESSTGVGENSFSDSLREDPQDVAQRVEESSPVVLRRPSRKPRQKSNETDARNGRSNQQARSDYCNSGEFGVSLYDSSHEASHARAESPLLRGYSVASEEQMINPKDEKWSRSAKLLRASRREEASYTPASTRNPSLIDSWDGTTSFGDNELDDYLDVQGGQGCGIPCYWSKKMKYNKTPRSCCSPSFSDALRRRRRTRSRGPGSRGSSILCAGQFMYSKPSRSPSPSPSLSPSASLSQLRRKCSKASTEPSPVLPLLLTDGRDHGAGSSGETLIDELSTDFGELDLEASSRLDGRRWSCCKSPSEQLALATGTGRDRGVPDRETPRSLSQKYRPRSFDELVGLKIVVQSLVNALSRGRIAPIYLFQGPRGTGKTSVARIFAAALNCLSTNEAKPCGFCKECIDGVAGKSASTIELDATNGKAMAKVKQLLEKASASPRQSKYRVLLIDECHVLSIKTWTAFLNLMEELPSHLVFIFITTEPETLPRAVASRCQRYLFPKIKEADIVPRLRMLAAEENMDVEPDALDLIALHSDGSLRDAETVLEQLGLLGKKITASLVNDFAGVVSDDKLLDLLELAMSSNTSQTVKRARELLDTGVDPLALMSQLAALIMDIIAGTDRLADTKCDGSVFDKQSLTEAELESLRHALKILSEAEKQLRLSSDRSTWFTAALLQIGSNNQPSLAPNKTKQNVRDADDLKEHNNMQTEGTIQHKMTGSVNKHEEAASLPISISANENASYPGGPSSSDSKIDINDNLLTCSKSLEGASAVGDEDVQTNVSGFIHISACELDEIWRRVVERCHSKTLRQLLFSDGKLVSVYEENSALIACIAFKHQDQKDRAERFLKSITNSMEIVLRHNVKVSVGLLSQMADMSSRFSVKVPSVSPRKQTGSSHTMVKDRTDNTNGGDHYGGQLRNKATTSNRNNPDTLEDSIDDSCDGSSLLEDNFSRSSLTVFPMEGNGGSYIRKYLDTEIAVDSTDAVVDEQKLESAWLQAVEKGPLGSTGQPKHVRNQVLSQDDFFSHNETASVMQPVAAIGHPGEDVNPRSPSIGVIGSRVQVQKYLDNPCPLSPSLLHMRSCKYDSDTGGYESAPGCNGILCWKTFGHRKGKAKPMKAARSHGSRWCSCVKCCGRLSSKE